MLVALAIHARGVLHVDVIVEVFDIDFLFLLVPLWKLPNVVAALEALVRLRCVRILLVWAPFNLHTDAPPWLQAEDIKSRKS